MSALHDTVRLLALQHNLTRADMNIAGLQCPECRSPDNSFSLKRLREGLLYNCYRAKCGIHGFVPTGELSEWAPHERKKERKLRRYYQQLHHLTDQQQDSLAERYHLSPCMLTPYARMTDDYRLALRVLGPYGEHRGWLIKQPPPCLGVQSARPDAPKVVSYVETDCSGLCWVPGADTTTGTAYVVEDILSAIRVYQDTHCPTIALCGTTLNQERVDELRAHGVRRVNLWLDYDARQKAYKYASKWGLTFEEFRVIVTKDDPKDCPEIEEVRV